MQDSLMNVVSLALQAQQQEMIYGFVKWMIVILVAPTVVVLIGVFVAQHFISRRENKRFLDGLKKEINGKVDYPKHDKAVDRLHSRIDRHTELNDQQFGEIRDGVGYIRGRIDEALKNEGPNAE